VFGLILRKNNDKSINACMYGAGHGGIEAASVLGLTMIGSLALSVSINSGLISTILDNVGGNDLTQLKDTVNTLTMSSPYIFLLGIVERIFAVILQISLSVLVWSSVKGKRYLFILKGCIVDFLSCQVKTLDSFLLCCYTLSVWKIMI